MGHVFAYIIIGFSAYGFGTFVGNVGDYIERRYRRRGDSTQA
jgi:hypothetical protein